MKMAWIDLAGLKLFLSYLIESDCRRTIPNLRSRGQ